MEPPRAPVTAALERLKAPATSSRRPPCACGDATCDGEYRLVNDSVVECELVLARQRAAADGGEVVDPNLPRVGAELRRYRRAWADLDTDHPSWRFVREVCEEPVELMLARRLSLVLLGPRGTGKTQAAVMLVDAALRAGRDALLVNWSEWWSRVTGTYRDDAGDSEASLIRELVRPDLVALDDVGSNLELKSQRAWALFERVVGARYDRGLPTVVTTNLSPAELAVAASGLEGAAREQALAAAKRKADDIPSRAFSRLNWEAHFLLFDGPNHRQTVDAAQRDAAVAAVLRRITASGSK